MLGVNSNWVERSTYSFFEFIILSGEMRTRNRYCWCKCNLLQRRRTRSKASINCFDSRVTIPHCDSVWHSYNSVIDSCNDLTLMIVSRDYQKTILNIRNIGSCRTARRRRDRN